MDASNWIPLLVFIVKLAVVFKVPPFIVILLESVDPGTAPKALSWLTLKTPPEI